MNTIDIQYQFRFEDGAQWAYRVELDPHDYVNAKPTPASLPEWTRLDYHRCTNCPLDSANHATCPAAAGLVELVAQVGKLPSHGRAFVQVRSAERSVASTTTVQRGVGSLLGLLLAASGCPRTAFFRPMARFHLPLASEMETIYRAASMYTLAQYFRSRTCETTDPDLNGLVDIYRELQVVNRGLAARLQSVCTSDGAINALILLDLLAKALPDSIEQELQEIHHLFRAYLTE